MVWVIAENLPGAIDGFGFHERRSKDILKICAVGDDRGDAHFEERDCISIPRSSPVGLVILTANQAAGFVFR
jgi:hypothetical protein